MPRYRYEISWAGVPGTPYELFWQVKEDMENHRKSHIKKKRKSGFRARMKTYGGRIVLGNKRRANKHANVKRHRESK